MDDFDIRYTALRRAVIEHEFESLNTMQQKAALKTEGPLLLLAGAGSGKTTVLINRIIHLLRFGKGYESELAPAWAGDDDLLKLAQAVEEPNLLSDEELRRLCAIDAPKPWEIIAITFTNKAASELKSRLEVACGDQGRDIWAHTFHTACTRVLRRNIDLLGYSSNFTIYDEDDKKRLVGSIIRDMGFDDKKFDPKGVMNQMARAKEGLLTPEEYAAQAGDDYYKKTVSRIYAEYQKRCRAASALDFDDIICKTVELLQEHESVRTYYQHKFRYVLVDEYQDTNHAQYKLCSLLAGGWKNLCVVGDDDQSIYKFRGASIANILEFEQQYPDAVTIRLEQNYRSTGTILNAANHVIAKNTGRKGKTLWTENEDGAKIQYYCADNQDEEAQYIAKTIHQSHAKGEKLKDFTVLYRNNALSNFLQTCFVRSSIPFMVVRGRSFLDSLEIRDMRAYLEVIHNPGDGIRLHRIINNPPRKIGAKTVETVSQLAAAQGVTEYHIIETAQQYPQLSRAADALKAFSNLIQGLADMKNQVPLVDLYDELLEKSGYRLALQLQGGAEAAGRLENIQELKSNIVDYCKRQEDAGAEPTLEGFLEELSLLSDVDKYDEDADVVTMMTMHSAKGLEFQKVFVCGAEEGLFPSYRSMESEEEMEEERRLCYVAMTRAKKELYITCSKRRMLYGQTAYAKPSRFISEIPEELVEYANVRTPADPANGEQAAQAGENPPRTDHRFKKPAPNRSFGTSSFTGRSIQPTFRSGMRIRHKAFGEGVITEVTPMGGDQLLNINFHKQGVKLMMAKTAAKFIEKL